MKTISKLAVVLSALLSLSGVVHAQNAIAPPPPQLEVLEEGPTISNQPTEGETQPGNSIEERRKADGTTEIKVKSGPSTYYVKPTKDRNGDPAATTQWTIKEFNAGGGKKTPDNAPVSSAKPAP